MELNVTGVGGVNFHNTTIVDLLEKEKSTFIQTDKAIYKPGDDGIKFFHTCKNYREIVPRFPQTTEQWFSF